MWREFWLTLRLSSKTYPTCILDFNFHSKYWIAGGTFALYSLLCRRLNIGILPSKRGDLNSNISWPVGRQSWLVKFFEGSIVARRLLLFIAMLGTCMLIGDGILTPAISGLPQNVSFYFTWKTIRCLRSFEYLWFNF